MTSSPDLTIATVKMVVSLAVILALVWGLYRFANRKFPNQLTPRGGRLIQVLESRYLGMKKSIAVIRVPDAILVVGIGSEHISLLSKVDNPEIIASYEQLESSGKTMSFKDHLKRLTRSS